MCVSQIDRILRAAEAAAHSSDPQLPALDTASYNWLIHGYANASPVYLLPSRFHLPGCIMLLPPFSWLQAEETRGCVSQNCCVYVEQAALPTNAAEVLRRIESSPWPEVQPNVVSYTSVIDAYAKSANYSAVRSVAFVLDSMDCVCQRSVCESWVVINSSVHGLPSQAKQVLETMRAAGLEPGIVAIGAVLNAAKKAATAQPEGIAIVQEAWDLFNTLDMKERNAFVYSSMIAALGQANMRDEAVELFEEAAVHLKPWCEHTICHRYTGVVLFS